MTAHPDINDLFGLLDKWRHFAGFPLEARSEVLFALFLPIVLEHRFKIGIKPQIIPQFPLKRDDSNQSNNVDFFAISEDGKRAFLIELKTDMNSWRKEQDCYLTRAAGKHMDEILCDLKKIAGESAQKRKYHHLLNALCELDLIELPSDSNGLSNLINGVRVPNRHFKPRVVYVQPREPQGNQPKVEGFKYIYFKEFADCIENQGNMGGLFAGYLRKWITDPAKHPPR